MFVKSQLQHSKSFDTIYKHGVHVTRLFIERQAHCINVVHYCL